MRKNKDYVFTSESVTEGHPDKIADGISDSVLDAVLKEDKNSRVACETMTGNGYVLVGGEITSKADPDITEIAREKIKRIGYKDSEYGFDFKSIAVFDALNSQSKDIARGVRKTGSERQGAGDQGMMTGFACSETEEAMPLPIVLAHKITKRMAEKRREKLPFLRPDGKSQVSVKYRGFKPVSVPSVVVAAQHDPGIEEKKLKEAIIEEVIRPVCGEYLTEQTKFHINSTGRFVKGGPAADCGLTGRKIVVDTYGGMAHVGGGCFSGKDPTKVDRSGAYMTRYAAKNVVEAGLAERCEIQVAYAIGVPDPVSININCFGTVNKDEFPGLTEAKIKKAVRNSFDFRAGMIIRNLNLLKPIYEKTSAYGHFGRGEFSWEKTNKVEKLQSVIS